jgi:hypothetical protein
MQDDYDTELECVASSEDMAPAAELTLTDGCSSVTYYADHSDLLELIRQLQTIADVT